MNRSAGPATALALLGALGLAACTSSSRPSTSPAPVPTSAAPVPSPSSATPAPKGSPSATPSPSAKAAACPAAYAAPDPDRPVVSLSFVVADSKATVAGRERVVFTPDGPTDRLVFRLWANAPVPRRSGGSTSVTRLVVDGRAVAFALNRDRTVLTAPLGRTAAAGAALTIDLDFTLTLPSGANERMGHSGRTAWFGSGFPLLAWERGRGWATEPATGLFAEAVTSEAFRLADLAVDTAPGDVVLATGATGRTAGRVRHRSAASVRDVVVAVGSFRTVSGRAGGVPVTVGVAPGLDDDPARLLALHRSGIAGMSARFGPFPYESLDVAVVPHLKGGVEFPAGILLGSGQDRDATLVHEIAHEWFYGLVGNNQGRDPWLDEAFATYAEGLVRGTTGRYLGATPPAAGRDRVGAPMTYWETLPSSTYYRSVYTQGAAALLRARQAAGATAWDRAVRCYVGANAHRVARPEDLREAVAAYPAAVTVLRRAGALRGS